MDARRINERVEPAQVPEFRLFNFVLMSSFSNSYDGIENDVCLVFGN